MPSSMLECQTYVIDYESRISMSIKVMPLMHRNTYKLFKLEQHMQLKCELEKQNRFLIY